MNVVILLHEVRQLFSAVFITDCRSIHYFLRWCSDVYVIAISIYHYDVTVVSNNVYMQLTITEFLCL